MRKTRAQQDAERLAALEEQQNRVDKGEIRVEDVVADIERAKEAGVDPAEIEAMYAELEARVAQSSDASRQPEPVATVAPPVEDHRPSLEQQLAEMRRQLSFYEQELNPAKRHAKELEREVEELRAQLAARVTQPEGPTDYGLTEEEQEFDTVKSIAEKVSSAQMKRLQKTIDDMNKKLSEFESSKTQMAFDAKINEHRSQVSSLLDGINPDTLFSHPKIAEWMSAQTDEEAAALSNPIAYSAKFVAATLRRFNTEVVKGQAKREPSHGESAVPARVAPDVVERKRGDDDSGVAFNPRTFQADVNKLISAGRTADAEKLIKQAERAVNA